MCLGQTFHWKFQASPKTGGVVGPPATKGRLVFLVFFGILMCVCRVKWGGGWGRVGWGGVCHAIEFFLAPDGSLAFACYATEGSHALAHRLHALLPKVLLHLHIDYATLLKNLLHLHMDVMLQSEFFLALAAHGLHATLPKVLSRLHTDLMLCYRSFSCTWIQTSCDARVVFQKILSCQKCSPSP